MKRPMSENKFYVTEIYDSIEGEGKRTGRMATFVRLAGCNLRCTYCDTKYSLERKDAAEVLTAGELVGRILKFPWKLVTFTGGEPMLHDLKAVIEFLCSKGYEVNIETNGAIPLDKYWKPEKRPYRMFFTMDWKSISSGMNKEMLKENLRLLRSVDVIKFVVGSKEDLDDMKKVIKGIILPKVYVSPIWGAIKPAKIVSYIKENKLSQCTVQVQLHKIIWDPMKRGV